MGGGKIAGGKEKDEAGVGWDNFTGAGQLRTKTKCWLGCSLVGLPLVSVIAEVPGHQVTDNSKPTKR